MSAARFPSRTLPTPTSRLAGLGPYVTRQSEWPISLSLDANEGVPCRETITQALASIDPEIVRSYPNAGDLEQKIAAYWNVDPSRVVVTNGGDEAIDRLCRSMLEPGRTALIHVPTFEMIERSAQLAGGTIRCIDWLDGEFPTEQFIDAIDDSTGLIALVTPNNPTGGTIDTTSVRAIADAAQLAGAVVLADLAYVEFADTDPTRELLQLPNTAIVRTFSKAMGLAGLRVGYAITSPEIADWMRTVGGPYPVSSLSLALAQSSFAALPAQSDFITKVRRERWQLDELLTQLGAIPLSSQANFITAHFCNAVFVRSALASLGVAVRGFCKETDIGDCLRFTLPGDEEKFACLARTLTAAMKPQTLLLDLDGVLADVSSSFRAAITQTARIFGVEVTPDEVDLAKQTENTSNDWVLTQQLLHDHGMSIPLSLVIRTFQSLYLGATGESGFRQSETLIPQANLLRRLASRLPLAIVTGRPRAEAKWFLDRAGIGALFNAIVCMEDASIKPSPDPVRLALRKLGVSSAWMIGDTPDDMRSARKAGVIPIGIVAPTDDHPTNEACLRTAGAARVIGSLDELEDMLP